MHGDLNMPLAGDPPPKTDPARPALVLLVASVVELIAAVVLCTPNDDSCDGTTAYAISAGAVSVALALLVLSALRYDDAMPGLLLDMVPPAPNATRQSPKATSSAALASSGRAPARPRSRRRVRLWPRRASTRAARPGPFIRQCWCSSRC